MKECHMTISSNRLANEPSAYLRQHAHNPVHWQPWDKKALEAARLLDRPILLSIGYAACHWCHVMAHESFEDEAVANVMNELFINVKVDREERPDIDQIYMSALTAMGQQGGWPLTIFLRPDGKPFWGGTYFPKKSTADRPGFVDILYAINNLWNDNKDKINHNAEAIFSHLEGKLAAQNEAATNDPTRFEQFADRISSLFDPIFGGISGAPKFPNAPFMDALWLSWLNNHQLEHRDHFLRSLRTMLQGGIYDHLGGGLCRYSTDAQWLVPHFEKMLYDNAQLIRHLNWAYAETNDDLFRIRIEETIEWMIDELRLDDGSFASSLDADSEGIEGKFYVWQADEIDGILGDQAPEFKEFYCVTRQGNWEGQNILNRLHQVHENLPLPQHIISAKKTLLSERNKRVRPARDDKALTDWNALAIRALTEAGRSLQRSDWIEHAQRAYQAVASTFQNGQLAHCRMDEIVVYPGLSSDYASMINAALALLEATGDPIYLEQAKSYKDALDNNHRDAAGNYRLSAIHADDVILHNYGDHDEAIPSATSQIIEAFTRLFLATGDTELYQQTAILVEQAMGRALNQHYGQIGIMNAGCLFAYPLSLTITAIDKNDPLVAIANQNPDPRRLDQFIPFETGKSINLQIGGTVETQAPAAWLCKGSLCLPPVGTAQELKLLLEE